MKESLPLAGLAALSRKNQVAQYDAPCATRLVHLALLADPTVLALFPIASLVSCNSSFLPRSIGPANLHCWIGFVIPDSPSSHKVSEQPRGVAPGRQRQAP